MESNRAYMMDKIEGAVCDAVNITFALLRPEYTDKAEKARLYTGNTNIPLIRSVARYYSFYVMHDKYGFTYNRISKRSGKHPNSVMRSVRRVREGIFIDPLYKYVNAIMTDKLNVGIL